MQKIIMRSEFRYTHLFVFCLTVSGCLSNQNDLKSRCERSEFEIKHSISNQRFQDCRTPTGDAGNCKLIRDCPFFQSISNYPRFLEYMCIIQQS